MDKEISQGEEEEEEGEQVGGESEKDKEKEETEQQDKSEQVKLETQESNEEVAIFKPKMKEFPETAGVVGLRIRAEPSFLVSFIK